MIRAAIFDVYGTLLLAPPGGVKPDPAVDAPIREVLLRRGLPAPAAPTALLHEAVRRHHERSSEPFPEVDLRKLWREILNLPEETPMDDLVAETEALRLPASPMPGATEALRSLAGAGVSLGLLSNAQCHTLACLEASAALFDPGLVVLSYLHGIAKPAPELFRHMKDKLESRGIAAAETLYVGNDPLHDIAPASACGFRTALFAADLEASAVVNCRADFTFRDWSAPEWHRIRTSLPAVFSPTGSCGER
jgi:HAD superfamily hydrolase (TIGR01549 family)